MTVERAVLRGSRRWEKSSLVLAVAAALASTAVNAAAPIGWVQTLQEEEPGMAVLDNPTRNLLQPSAAAISPDGKYVYLAAAGDSAINVFARDAATGQLSEVQVLGGDTGSAIYGVIGVQQIVMAPDGANVYSAALIPSGPIYQGSLVAFRRNPDSGQLSFGGVMAQSWLIGQPGKPDAHLATSDARMAVSPDGKQLYYVCMDVAEVIVFDVGANGSLAYNTVYAANPDPSAPSPLDQISNSHEIVVSPDGANVYVVGAGAMNSGGDVVVFSRDAASGALTPVESHQEGVAGVTGLKEPYAAAISADGKNLYVASSKGNAVVVFDRAGDGKLTYAATVTYVDTVSGKNVLAGAQTINVSADAKFVYTGTAGATVAVFARDTATGALSALGFVADGMDGLALGSVKSAALSADGQNLYVATRDKVNGVTAFGANSDVSIVIQDGVNSVHPGADYTYTVTVANAGPATAAGVTATVTLPAEVTLVAANPADASANCSTDAAVITCVLGDLAAHADSVISIKVKAPAQGMTVTASAVAATTSVDNVAANNADDEQTTISTVPVTPVDNGGGTPADTTGTAPTDSTGDSPAGGTTDPAPTDPAPDAGASPNERTGGGGGGAFDLLGLAAGLFVTLRRRRTR